MNGFIAYISEWLLSVPGNAGSQSKNRLWDKLPNCSLEGLRGHMPVFLLRMSMFLKAKLNPVLLCISLNVSEAEHSAYVRVSGVFISQWSIHVLWLISATVSSWMMGTCCVFNFMSSFNVTLISLSSVVPAFSCHAWEILHCSVRFTRVSRWLTALTFDPGIIKFIGNVLG